MIAPLTDENEKKKRLFFFVLVLALAAIFFSGVPFLSTAQVAARLKDLSAQFAAYAHESGGEAALTYGGVDITGVGYTKKAVVKNVEISVVRSAWLGNNRVTLSTPQMLYVPDPSGSGQFRLEFPAPLTLAFDGVPAYTVMPLDGAAKYFVMRRGAVLTHTLLLPPKLEVTPAGLGQDKAFVVTYGASPKLTLVHTPATGRAQTSVEFQHVSVFGAKNARIDAFSLTAMREPVAGGKLAFDINTALTGLSITGEHGAEGPYAFSLSGAGTRIAPTAGTLPPPDTDFTLRALTLSADKFTLTATGNVSRKADDSLPYGAAEVKVENFSSLRGAAALSPEVKAALMDVAGRITGLDAGKADAFAFTVKREKLGNLAVGNATLADVVGAFLSHIMLGSEQPPAPVMLAPAPAPAPPPAKKK